MLEPGHRVPTEDAEGVFKVEIVADEYLRLGLDQLGSQTVELKMFIHHSESKKPNRFLDPVFEQYECSSSLIFKLSRIELAVGRHDAAAA